MQEMKRQVSAKSAQAFIILNTDWGWYVLLFACMI